MENWKSFGEGAGDTTGSQYSYVLGSDDIPQCGELSDTESRDYCCEMALDPRVSIGSVRRVELVGIADPNQIGIVLNVVELQ